VSNELRRTIGKRFDGNELTALIGLLETKKENESKILKRKIEDASRSNAKIDVEKEEEQILANYNRDILKLFEVQSPKLEEMSGEFHNILENINWFRLFMDDFEKSLVFIISARQISTK
jgi:uncharacterized membrane protein